MNVFCLLCIPLLYFLRRPALEKHSIWALPVGCVAAAVRYFTGPLLTPSGFGLFRWVSGFVDIIALPALLPLLLVRLLVSLKLFPRDVDYAGFALLWFAPIAVVQSLTGSSLPSPMPLVLVPLLWAAQAIGFPFFTGLRARTSRPFAIVFLTLGAIAVPAAATSSWWYFFRQEYLFGCIALVASLIPALASFIRMRN